MFKHHERTKEWLPSIYEKSNNEEKLKLSNTLKKFVEKLIDAGDTAISDIDNDFVLFLQKYLQPKIFSDFFVRYLESRNSDDEVTEVIRSLESRELDIRSLKAIRSMELKQQNLEVI